MAKIDSSYIRAGEYADALATIGLLEQSFDEGNFDVHEELLSQQFSFSSPFGSFNDVKSYMTWLRSFYNDVTAQGGTRHTITNPIVRIDKEEAFVFSYLIIFNRKTMTVMGTSSLHDILQKENGIWRCKSRVVYSDQFSKG